MDEPCVFSKELISVRSLEVFAHIGVPSCERATPQKLLLDIEIEPSKSFVAMADQIEETVDYYQATRDLIALAAERPRKLIETLAADCAQWILAHYPANRVSVRVRKFILPDTQWVGVWTEVQKSLDGKEREEA